MVHRCLTTNSCHGADAMRARCNDALMDTRDGTCTIVTRALMLGKLTGAETCDYYDLRLSCQLPHKVLFFGVQVPVDLKLSISVFSGCWAHGLRDVMADGCLHFC